jgi:hypothetical protein
MGQYSTDDGKTVVEIEAGERTVEQELAQIGEQIKMLSGKPQDERVAGIRAALRDLTELLAYELEAGHGGG